MQPTTAGRIPALDVLRGLAILGILFLNINGMGAALEAPSVDIRHLGWSPIDQVAWWLREVLASGTARGALQLLFGAGLVMLFERLAARIGEEQAVRQMRRRYLVLTGIGLLHVFVLLWPGDILHIYGLAALILLPLRRADTRLLVLVGLSYVAVTSATGMIGLIEHGSLEAAGAPTPEAQSVLIEEDRARSSGMAGWAGALISHYFYLLRIGSFPDWLWEAVATMALGAVLFRWGVLQGQRSGGFYAALALAGYAVGLPLRIAAAWQLTRFDGGWNLGWASFEVARLAMTIGHVATVNWMLAAGRGGRLLAPFAAAGRLALSLYLLQSLIGLWLLFPPFGLGLYGRLGWAGLMVAALLVNLLLLWLAAAWSRRFAVGAAEWAWRSLGEGRRLPFRATPGGSPADGVA